MRPNYSVTRRQSGLYEVRDEVGNKVGSGLTRMGACSDAANRIHNEITRKDLIIALALESDGK